MKWVRIKAIIWKELIQIRRDKPSLAIALAMPLMMMLVFGFAVNTDVDHIDTMVFDQDMSSASRKLINSFENTGIFDIIAQVYSQDEIRKAIDSGKAKAGLIIPPDFNKALVRGETAGVQILIDGSDPLVASKALSTAQMLVQVKSFDIQKKRLEKRGFKGNMEFPISLSSRVWYNPNMESIKFNIPGLVGVILQNITVLLTAFALVRERERGTLEQLIITPIRPAELIIGKLIPYIFIGLFDVLLVIALAVFLFSVPIKGSFLLLMVLSIIFLWTALGFGLLISTVAKNQLQAMQASVALILPSILLSGFMFPRESMPDVIYFIGNIFPITYFLKILRGIILKGIGVEFLLQEVIWLTVMSAGIFILSVLRFRKRLD
ncbi:MAG: ABC transporter permease [Bacillota bacterium]|nr:ABC transporter permease [Clostridia bacterium]